MTFLFLYSLAAFFIWIASLEFPGICRINSASVKKFVIFMLWITALRIILFKIGNPPAVSSDPQSPMNTINILTTLGVFWEDAIFTLPILIADRKGASKMTKVSLMFMAALTFASGHISYGLPWAAITLLYIPFISFKYGKANGLGTVMVCHMIYDLITLITVRYLIG